MKIFDFQQVIHHLLSLKKISSPTAAVIVAFTVLEIRNTKNVIKLEYISYTMTLDCEKKLKCNKMADFWKKNQNLLKNLMVVGLTKLYFLSNHKTGGSFYEKKIYKMLKKDPSRSDDLLSSYSCSKFEKCSFEKNAFKDKSTDFIVINFQISYLELICYSRPIQFTFFFFTKRLLDCWKMQKKNRNF